MLAIIPARGGSKGLPGKNIKELCGKPLIAYAIEAAKNAKCIDRVIVTTDSEQIAEVSKQFGAEVPFLRPDELSGDTAKAADVYLHAIEWINDKEKVLNDKFMVLLPTAPLRTSEHIDEAFELYIRKKAKTVISMTEAETPPSWYFGLCESGVVKNAGFDVARALNNRQGNPTYYIPNGAIYILDYELLKTEKTYYSDETYPYIMNRSSSIDIDTLDDFKYAEFLLGGVLSSGD